MRYGNSFPDSGAFDFFPLNYCLYECILVFNDSCLFEPEGHFPDGVLFLFRFEFSYYKVLSHDFCKHDLSLL